MRPVSGRGLTLPQISLICQFSPIQEGSFWRMTPRQGIGKG
jgi:hypothetical protein